MNAGFRRGRGCSDQIFVLRNIIEQCTEWQRELYINFVDFQKAFDSIHRESIMENIKIIWYPRQNNKYHQKLLPQLFVQRTEQQHHVPGKDRS